MDKLDIIIALEEGELTVNNFEELEELKNVCREFAYSQGFYGRLLRDIEAANIEESDFPLVF